MEINKNYRRPSIKDVARFAGVSAQTVSNYLNKKVNIRQKTRHKIESAINELGYIPNIFAKGLRGVHTKTVGVIISEMANPFFAAIVDGIEEIATKNAYTILLASSSYKEEKLINELNKFIMHVDGIILCTDMVNENVIKYILQKGIPIVAIDIKIENDIVPSVEVDNYKAIYNGVEYLINKGHTNIYFLSEPIELESMILDRLNGYKDCLKDHDISIDESKIILNREFEINKSSFGYTVMKNIFNSMQTPLAVFGTSDLIIIGAMKAAWEKKMHIPNDISFLGCDNVFFAEFTNPPLTSINYNEKEMGRKGMELLNDLILGKKINKKRIFIETNIIERKTVSSLI